ncbi:hypothetical protein FQA39_LY03959 [Lamprigera yunnana]|nr:hypothetical protein FQA39_LY03959 [Lamprigera yunnana]
MLYWLSLVMAEGTSNVDTVEELETKDKITDNLECAVCLQQCIHPAQLPCGHIFCFLCVKGISHQSRRCAMCRQEIPGDFLDHPKLLQRPELLEKFDGAFQWFYEGRNGWWQYDERTSKDLETSYKAGQNSCELLIAGLLYIADLDKMIQIRKNDHSKRRNIKRDLSTAPKKGVAGLRTESELQQSIESQSLIESHRSQSPIEGRTDNLIPITPSNTPQTPASGRESPYHEDLEATIERIRSLRLHTSDILAGVQISQREQQNSEENINEIDVLYF